MSREKDGDMSNTDKCLLLDIGRSEAENPTYTWLYYIPGSAKSMVALCGNK